MMDFSDKITTHGRSHLSLLRESYQKNDLKRKIIAVKKYLSQLASVISSFSSFKVSFTAGFCHFFFF